MSADKVVAPWDSTKPTSEEEERTQAGLKKLRAPFDARAIGKLPRATRPDAKPGKCSECGGWHKLPAIHLDYVGHAEVTDRLLSVDPRWDWKPLAKDENGLPRFVRAAGGNPIGLWIELTVLGMTRLGYGSVEGHAFDAEKQLIGDCLISGTPVLTRDGQVPIEDVRPGMLVANRSGWKRVTDQWQNGEADRTLAVLLEDGRMVVGTGNHRVPTARGIVALRNLHNGDSMFAWPDTDDYPTRWNWNGAGGVGDDTRSPPTDICASTGRRQLSREDFCIARSTSRSSVQSQGAGTSTIATTIRSITRSEILSLSRQPNTLGITTRSARASSMYVGAAETSSSLRRGLVESSNLAGAQADAARRGGGRMGLPASSRRLASIASRACVRSAEPSSLESVRGLGFAPVRVVAVLDAGIAPTWNLSVADRHEYVAGGVLVFNSIRNAAMRFGVALDLWSKAELESTLDAAETVDKGTGEIAAKPTEEARMQKEVDAFAGGNEPAAPRRVIEGIPILTPKTWEQAKTLPLGGKNPFAAMTLGAIVSQDFGDDRDALEFFEGTVIKAILEKWKRTLPAKKAEGVGLVSECALLAYSELMDRRTAAPVAELGGRS